MPLPVSASKTVHRYAFALTPCGLATGYYKSTRDPEKVTCGSCRRAQRAPGAVVAVVI